MKVQIMMAALALGLGFILGCKKLPTPEVMHVTSTAVGVAAGKVANELKVDDGTRNAIIDVMNIAVQVVPGVDQTFEDAWTPIAESHIAKLVADGKLTAAQAALVKSAFVLAVKGLDYLFISDPESKKYENLVISAIDGFAGGFLGEFKPANANAVDRVYRPYDRKAYEYLKGFAK